MADTERTPDSILAKLYGYPKADVLIQIFTQNTKPDTYWIPSHHEDILIAETTCGGNNIKTSLQLIAVLREVRSGTYNKNGVALLFYIDSLEKRKKANESDPFSGSDFQPYAAMYAIAKSKGTWTYSRGESYAYSLKLKPPFDGFNIPSPEALWVLERFLEAARLATKYPSFAETPPSWTNHDPDFDEKFWGEQLNP